MKLLFICTHNRCRSILAEAITNHISNGKITAASAGSTPQDQVHPMSLKFLSERNIPTQGLRSKSWHDFETFHPDAVLTLCDSAAEEACPIWFDLALKVHWSLEDPSKENEAGQQRKSFEQTIDIIERRIKRLLEADTETLSGSALRDQLTNIAAEIQ